MLGYPISRTGAARDLFDRMADGKDPFVRRFVAALPKDLVEAINCAWAKLPPKEKRSFGRPDARSRTVSFEEALSGYALRQEVEVRAAAEKQRILYRAFERAHLIPGARMRDTPDLADLRDFQLVFDRSNNACCVPHDETPPAARRAGIRLTHIQCLDETGDFGFNDEISLLCVVVDGNAKVTTTQTAEYSMDEGDNRTLNTIIYGPADPKGFLDIAIAMVEHDKTDAKAGQTITAIGNALSSAGVKTAGIALEIIGAVVSLILSLIEDDPMGTRTASWTGDVAATAAGQHIFSYSKSGDYHYRVGFNVFALD